MEAKLPALLLNYDRQTNQPTDRRRMDRRAHEEVLLPMTGRGIE